MSDIANLQKQNGGLPSVEEAGKFVEQQVKKTLGIGADKKRDDD